MSDVLKEGNTAVVTGASSGIGRAAAVECAKRGMNVWLIDIDHDELQSAREFVQSQALPGQPQVKDTQRSSFTNEK